MSCMKTTGFILDHVSEKNTRRSGMSVEIDDKPAEFKMEILYSG